MENSNEHTKSLFELKKNNQENDLEEKEKEKCWIAGWRRGSVAGS